MPETSVLIRTFNEEKYLPGLLQGIQVQEYRDYEIVVVDSGSFDRTRDIAERYGAKVVRIKSEDFTFGYSLNVGVTASAGRFIACVSAHTKPLDASWLGNLVEPLRDDTIAMTYGRQVGWSTSKFGDTQDLRRTFGGKPLLLRPPNFFANNANSAIRRDLWQQHHFDEALTGLEDIEWARHWMSKGYQVAYQPSAGVYHIHEETWPQVRRRYYREALAAKAMGITGPAKVPSELAKEGLRFFGDVAIATRTQGGLAKLPEIALFRINKAAGTFRGLVDGKTASRPPLRYSMYFNKTVRSVVIGGQGRAELKEMEAPRLKPADVLVRTAYAGVTQVEHDIFAGTHSYYKNGPAKYPIVPGREVSGYIAAVGAKVANLAENTPVVIAPVYGCGKCDECKRSRSFACPERTELGVLGWNGGYSDYVLTPSTNVIPLPSGIDMRTAVLTMPLATVLKGLNRLARAWAPSPKLKECGVVGVGPMGHLTAKALATQGHKVTVFDRNPRRLEYFKDSKILPSTNLAELGRCEVLVETSGDPESLGRMIEESPSGAAILLLGIPEAQQRVAFSNLAAYDKVMVGSVGFSTAEIQDALGLLRNLDVKPFFESEMSLEQYEAAWRQVRSGQYLKTLLRVLDG